MHDHACICMTVCVIVLLKNDFILFSNVADEVR
jgi:hypothetical protein